MKWKSCWQLHEIKVHRARPQLPLWFLALRRSPSRPQSEWRLQAGGDLSSAANVTSQLDLDHFTQDEGGQLSRKGGPLLQSIRAASH